MSKSALYPLIEQFIHNYDNLRLIKEGQNMVKSKVNKVPKELQLFREGENYFAYEYFGAHKTSKRKKEGVVFRVWAPNAKNVSVVGDFNNWDTSASPADNISNGVWEAFIPDIPEYSAYKYAITHQDGSIHYKADPYAFHSETDGSTASKVYFLDGCFKWSDDAWLKKRADIFKPAPMNIYEVHIGSWKIHEDGNPLNYRDLADELIPYAKDMGYTHLELMPITEYPFPASWGYQVTGYFSVTSRYGVPADFMYFVNKAHKAGLGVIIDWVPAHFPKDDFALARFDGTPLYEDPNPLRGEHKSWGTLIFDFGKAEIQSFLVSSAMMFAKEYHIDGIRVDAVAAMLYLDYDRPDGQWCPNEHGGHENLQAIAFLQKLNHAIATQAEGTIMIAEESTAWPLVTRPSSDGGLGFHYKWNMGWMNDSLSYIKTDPYFRKFEHGKLTFPMMYAYSENYILPISHDEVVYGKGSLLNKMPGDYEQKFAGFRGFLMYMLSHPGKKLLFMGSELGQFDEWNFNKELDWNLLEYETHRKLHDFVRDANHFYLNHKALWEIEDDWAGFSWLNADDADHNIISYKRISKSGRDVIFVINFSPVLRENYYLGVDKRKTYKEIFNTDDVKYGGSGLLNKGKITTKKGEVNGRKQYVSLTIPPFAAVVIA